MPRLFPDHFTTAQLQQALTELQQGPHAAIPANAIHFPLSKGIYFWYMRPEGYQVLAQHIALPQPLNGQTIDQHGNHLVYLGTAGVGIGLANAAGIQNRLVWHISQHHTIGNICNGFLSTLRTTLGALLANDLLDVNGVQTELLVNQFMADYLSLTYIAYEGEVAQVGPDINADEHKLITTLKPLLNLRNNPDIGIPGHPARQVKDRRMAINQATKNRVCQP